MLGATVDGSSVFKAVMRKIRDFNAQGEYVELIDEQVKLERSHSHIDIRLDKHALHRALLRESIDFKKVPLVPDELDRALINPITKILTNGTAICGSSDLERHRASAMLKRVHEQFFARLIARVPELAQALQHRDVMQKLSELGVILASQSGKLDQVIEASSATSHGVAQLTHDSRTIVMGVAGARADIQQYAQLIDHFREEVQSSLRSLDSDETLRQIQRSQQQILDLLNASTSPHSGALINTSYSADETPQFGSIFSSRQRVVSQLVELVNSHQWVAIRGETGSGKTGLATFVFNALQDRPRLWISFVGKENDRARQHLRNQLELRIIQDGHLFSTNASLTELAIALSSSMSSGVVFLDNLPDANEQMHDAFYLDLRILARSLSQHGITVLSTSQRDLPTNLNSLVDTTTFQAPSFTDAEILDALLMAGAPDFYQTSQIVANIRTVTSGLPSLVFAYIAWYKRHNWPQEQFWETILTEAPGREVKEESQKRVFDTLDNNALELLLRLSLLISDFDVALVNHIAGIAVAIPYPQITFGELKHVCVTQLTSQRFQVSPLFKGSGRSNLPEEKQLALASSAADFYLHKGTPINIQDIFAISIYLWTALRHTEYTAFLTQALMQITNESQAKYLQWAVHVPSVDIPFPQSVPISAQLILRTQQFRVALLANVDVTQIDQELDRLIPLSADAQSQAYAYIMAGALVLSISPRPTSFSIETAIHRTFEGIRMLTDDPTLFDQSLLSHGNNLAGGSEDYLLANHDIAEVVWFFSSNIRSTKQATRFLQEVYVATPQVRDRIFALPFAAVSLPYILDQLWMRETDKPEDSRNWEEVFSQLDQAIAFADANGMLTLKVAATRAKAISLSYATKSADASSLLEPLLPTENIDLTAWINITLALMHNDYGQPETAKIYLEAAINSSGTIAEQWRGTMRKHLIAVYSKLSLWSDAKAQALLALKEVKTLEHPEYSRLEILGELAFIHWNLKDLKRLSGTFFAILKSLHDRVLFSEEEFNEIYHKFANAMSWYSQKSQGLNIDEARGMIVEAGYFMRSWPNLRRYKNSSNNTLIGPAVPLLNLAIRSNVHGLAWRIWQLIKASTDLDGSFYKLFTHADAASLEARFGSPELALQFGVSSLKFKAVGYKLYRPESAEAVFRQVELEADWNELSEDTRKSYESLLMNEVFVPLLIQIMQKPNSASQISQMFQEYRTVLARYQDLASIASLMTNINDFESLLLTRIEGRTVDARRIASERSDLPARLVTHDIDRSNGLAGMLAIQLGIASHLWENRNYYPIKHTLYGFGCFLYLFWQRAIRHQRFRFSNPSEFENGLLSVSPRESEKTVARILRLATGAINVELNEAVRTFFREAME